MRKIYRLALGISVLLSAIAPASAATINFELSFFDDSNRRVGSGTFSYDDESSTCIEPDGGSNFCNPSNVFEDVTVTNILDNFEADISVSVPGNSINTEWQDEYAPYWWNDEEIGQNPGGTRRGRFGDSFTDNSWFFGDPFYLTIGGEALFMDFDRSSNTFGSGSWDIEIFPNFENESIFGSDPIFDSGTFEARLVEETPEPNQPPIPTPEPNPEPDNPTSIPEPSNILGSLVAMSLGYSIWRTFSKAKQSKIE